MSLAWEVTEEDVVAVLKRNGVRKSRGEITKIHDNLDHDKVEAVVLRSTDFDEQCEDSLDEIERQLKESGVIL